MARRWAGDNSDTIERMIVDSDSSIYIGAQSFSTGTAGQQDSLIIKLNSTYDQQWGKFYGGSLDEETGDIAVATDGVYVAGITQTTSLSSGGRDIFVLKLSKTDGSKTFAKLYGSTNDEYAVAIQYDSDSIYIGGYSASTGWTSAAFDFIVFKLNATDGTKTWSKYYGNANVDLLSDIIISGSIIYGLGAGDIGQGGDDLLLFQLSTSTGVYSSYAYFGGSNTEKSSRMTIDSSNSLYIAGLSTSSGLTSGFDDILIMKVNSTTNAISWGVYVGSSTSNETVQDILLSSDGASLYTIGYTSATEITIGSNDILMIKSSASDGTNEFVVHLGGTIEDYGKTMYVQSNGKFLIGGETSSPNLSAASTLDLIILEVDSQGRNQCSQLTVNVTTNLTATSFNLTRFTISNIVPNTNDISDDVRTASGDTLSDTSTSYGDICANYNPIIAEEGQGNLTALEDTAFTSTLQEFCDSTGATLTYTLTQSDGSAIPSWLSFNSTTRVISGTPSSSDAGTVTYNYTATDASSSASTVQFTTYVNRKPVQAITISDQTTRITTAFSLTISSGTFTDPDGDTITYSVSNLPSWATFTTANLSIDGTPSSTDVGSDTVTLTATETNSLSASTTFKINVTSNNFPVLSTEIPDQTAPKDVAYSYTFPNTTFTDADNDTLTYTIANNPSYIAFDASTRTLSGTPTEDYAYNVTITATDGFGGSVSDTFLLTLGSGIPNTAPTLNGTISEQTAFTSRSFSFTFSSTLFYDSDNDTLAYSSVQNDNSSLPSWLVFDSSTRTYGGTPDSSDINTYTIRIEASDGNGGTANTTFQVKVDSFSGSDEGIAIILIIVIIVLFIIGIIVIALLCIRKRKIDRQREVESDSSSDDEDEEIVDKNGALTQFLANTHKLEGNKFIPNPDTGAIYQKKSLDSLFTPLDSVKKFFKAKYGFDYDEDKGMFTATSTGFNVNQSKKNKNNQAYQSIDPLNQDPGQIDEDPNEEEDEEKVNLEDEEEEKLSRKPAVVSSKIVVKAKGRKGSKKKSKKKLNKVGVSDSPIRKTKSQKQLNGSPPGSPKTTKSKKSSTKGGLVKKSKPKRPKSTSPKAKSNKNKSQKSPSPSAKSARSGKAKSVKSAKPKSVKSTKSVKSGKSGKSGKSV